MRILELVLQGVAGSPAQTKLQIGAGTTVVCPGNASLPLGRLVSYALYDESVEPPPELRAPGAQVSRIAVTLQDHAGTVYRVVRDLQNGAVQLSRYAAEEKVFQTVSSRAAETGQYLRGQARLAAEDLFEDLLWLEAGQLPSRWTPPAEASSGGPKRRLMPVMGGAAAAAQYEEQAGAGGAASAPPPRLDRPMNLDTGGGGSSLGPTGADPHGHLSLEERREKLADLEKRKATLEEADDLQFELDGKQRALFEIEEKLGKVSEIEKEVEKLETQAREQSGLDALGDDIDAKLKEYSFLETKLNSSLERVEEDLEKLKEKMEIPVEPPWKNPFFVGGVVATLLFTLVGVFFEPMRWVLFLNLVSLGFVAFTLLEWLGELEEIDGVDSRRSALEERAEQAKRQFEMETTAVRLAMSRADVKTPKELQERFKLRGDAQRRYEAAAQKLKEAKEDPSYPSLEAEREDTERQIGELEERLRQCDTAGLSPMDLMRDIESLRESIERAESPEMAEQTDFGQAGFGLGAGAVSSQAEQPAGIGGGDLEAPSGPTMPDPGPRLLSRVGDALLVSPADAGEKLQQRVSQFAAALTEGRVPSVTFAGKGGGLVMTPAGGGSAMWSDLASLDRDLVYLGIRLALMEAVLRVGPQPLVLDAPFDDTVDRSSWPTLAKIVRHLGSLSQALHCTSEQYWAESSDARLVVAESG